MFGTHFYHETIRNLVVAFGSMFNNISISRKDRNTGLETERIKVPLSYSNKEKFLRRIREDSKLDQAVAMQLPRMGFEFTSISYDASRKRNTSLRRTVEDSGAGSLKSMYTEVPYNMNFTLYVATRHVDDGLQVIEQILPFFTPEFTVTLKLEDDLAKKVDVPIVLTSSTSEYDYEGSFEDTRTLTWTLDFTVKANLYSPVKTSGIILDSAVIFKDMEALGLDRPIGALSRTLSSVTGTARDANGASGPNDFEVYRQLDIVTGSGSPISGPDINIDGDGIGLDWV